MSSVCLYASFVFERLLRFNTGGICMCACVQSVDSMRRAASVLCIGMWPLSQTQLSTHNFVWYLSVCSMLYACIGIRCRHPSRLFCWRARFSIVWCHFEYFCANTALHSSFHVYLSVCYFVNLIRFCGRFYHFWLIYLYFYNNNRWEKIECTKK